LQTQLQMTVMHKMAADKEQFRIEHGVFDEFTKKNINKLSSQGYFQELTNYVALGKEANVYLGKKDDGSYCCVKIYRVENCNFKKMYGYIKNDPRYADLKGRRREIIFSWVQREFRNLHKAREAGVRVPTPYAVEKNVIVMELIGEPTNLAPQIKNIAPVDPDAFIADIVEQMRLLYQKVGIVHADLSMFNILNDDEKPVIIDMSQSTAKEDTNAGEYIRRDIENIATYAKRVGVSFDIEAVTKKIIGNDNLNKKK